MHGSLLRKIRWFSEIPTFRPRIMWVLERAIHGLMPVLRCPSTALRTVPSCESADFRLHAKGVRTLREDVFLPSKHKRLL